jgi:Raf kinase inhibitor-like YbhB/YbcL family protein
MLVRSALLACALLEGLLAQAASSDFSLSSPDFAADHPIPAVHLFNQYGCTGGNESPALQWHGAPAGTKSYAITMFDLDEVGSPSGWWHWVVYDIPGSATQLTQNAGRLHNAGLPGGSIQGRTDMGRYLITLYALSVAKLPVPTEASGAMVSFTVRDYTLAKATLTARYGR